MRNDTYTYIHTRIHTHAYSEICQSNQLQNGSISLKISFQNFKTQFYFPGLVSLKIWRLEPLFLKIQIVSSSAEKPLFYELSLKMLVFTPQINLFYSSNKLRSTTALRSCSNFIPLTGWPCTSSIY